MSRLVRIVVVAVLTLASIALATGIVAAGQTDRQRYEAAIKKVALPIGSFLNFGKLSKAMCVCNPSDHVGFLETFAAGSEVGITCVVSGFAPDGSLSIVDTCYDWTLITK